MEDKIESIKKVREVVNEVMNYVNQKELVSLLYSLSLEIEDINLMKKLTEVLKEHKSSFTNENEKPKLEI